MIYQWVHESYGPGGLFAMTVGAAFVLYGVLAGGSYWLFFLRMRRRFFPDYTPDPKEIRRSVAWSACSLLGNALLVLPIQLLIVYGNSHVYYDVAEYGWGYLGLSFVGIILVSETMIYWIHRGLHTRFLYRHVHVYHHKFHEPTPLMCLAFHPIDSFSQSLPYHLFALALPINFWLYLSLVLFVTVWTVMIHDRIRWVPGRLINHTGCHTAHHWYNKDNYGQYFTFWDRLCGTFRDPADLPERFVASKVPGYRPSRASAVEAGAVATSAARVRTAGSKVRIARLLS